MRNRIKWFTCSSTNANLYQFEYHGEIEFDCILTNVNLEKLKTNRFRLADSEKERIEDILRESLAEEVRSLLIQARSLDSGARAMRDGAFEALERYSAFHPESNAEVDVWRRRVAAKLEEVAHLEHWLAERRERQREERREEERLARARSEAAYRNPRG